MNIKVWFFILLTGICIASSAQTFTVNNNAHSHNDYLRNQPFHDAYSHRFASIETDLFLVDGKLYVAHERKDITEARTFETLYLTPLLEQVKLNGGKAYPDGGSLQLLVDLKTDGEPTLRALEKTLKPVRKYFDVQQNPNAIRVVISGNIPSPERFDAFDRIFWFDGRPNISYTAGQMGRVAFYSASLGIFSDWNGLGRFPDKEYRRIHAFVDSIHTLGKKVRFWGNPDTKTCWQAFIKLGVDYLNTDNPSELASFLNKYPQSSHVSSGKGYQPYRPLYEVDGIRKKPKNIIMLISDGAGFSEIWAAATANNGVLNVMNCRNNGYLRTHSADDYNTDSAAAGTAIATGQKTRNRHIGVDTAGNRIANIVERLSVKGIACGIVSNDHIAGATPSAFYAHCSERSLTDSILSYLLQTPAAFVAGGGNLRDPGMQQLAGRLEKSGYAVCEGISRLNKMPSGKQVVCFDTDNYDTGYRLIETAFDESVKRLANPNGFFLMMEGAKIDKGGHARDINVCIDEYLSFDRMVGKAMDFADRNGETLVIVTSDHETGGLVLLDGNYRTGSALGDFSTSDHTGTPVPIFSYGPGADRFTGFIDNSEIAGKILSLME